MKAAAKPLPFGSSVQITKSNSISTNMASTKSNLDNKSKTKIFG